MISKFRMNGNIEQFISNSRKHTCYSIANSHGFIHTIVYCNPKIIENWYGVYMVLYLKNHTISNFTFTSMIYGPYIMFVFTQYTISSIKCGADNYLKALVITNVFIDDASFHVLQSEWKKYVGISVCVLFTTSSSELRWMSHIALFLMVTLKDWYGVTRILVQGINSFTNCIQNLMIIIKIRWKYMYLIGFKIKHVTIPGDSTPSLMYSKWMNYLDEKWLEAFLQRQQRYKCVLDIFGVLEKSIIL
jgi:hypothetical protein